MIDRGALVCILLDAVVVGVRQGAVRVQRIQVDARFNVATGTGDVGGLKQPVADGLIERQVPLIGVGSGVEAVFKRRGRQAPGQVRLEQLAQGEVERLDDRLGRVEHGGPSYSGRVVIAIH